jgi:hypothetical protein
MLIGSDFQSFADINRGVLKTFIAGNGAMWKKMTTFAAKFQSNKY